ncbi:hypothetical protein PHYPSEUDO_014372 [Phytophthora pseudosyringae]|uniref:Uncharacterized protein n=1 Tax=Phytophthora pseudosyringae TaxID=221518 RepID=A0A8T1W429_9STRA|nr:hypothetical protein PHYPSEUDO_014372 [Phytophthora pseudosyringae]
MRVREVAAEESFHKAGGAVDVVLLLATTAKMTTSVAMPPSPSPPILEGKVPAKATKTYEPQTRQEQQALETALMVQPATQSSHGEAQTVEAEAESLKWCGCVS